jgi:ABC-type uncharacterized transport system substrate-binding protein
MPKTIGILHSNGNGVNETQDIGAFITKLASLGYSEPKEINIIAKYHADDDPQTRKDNARDLVNANPDLIIAAGGSGIVYAAQQATQNAQTDPAKRIPVVFTTFSKSKSPAPNMTGVDAKTTDGDLDRMDRLFDKVNQTWPAQRYGVLENQKRSDWVKNRFDQWANQKGIPTPEYRNVYKDPGDSTGSIEARIDAAFAAWRGMGIRVALVTSDPLFYHHRSHLIRTANGDPAPSKKYHITTMYQWHDFVDDGGDMAFGTPIKEAYEQAAIIAAQVLGGTKPSAIPVQVLQNRRMKP